MEATADGKNSFFTFNLGHLLTIITTVLGMSGGVLVFMSRFEGHEYRIQALERSDLASASLPSRTTVLETRLDVLQAQLTQLNMTSNRTNDNVQAIREDIAALKQAAKAN